MKRHDEHLARLTAIGVCAFAVVGMFVVAYVHGTSLGLGVMFAATLAFLGRLAGVR